MKSGEIYRTARPYSAEPEYIDGLKNYFAETTSLDSVYAKATLDKGINSIQKIKAIDGERRPAILLRSSPHKYESEQTPWKDIINEHSGNVVFFGDNKTADKNANNVSGNAALIEQVALQNSNDLDSRNLAAPLLLFESISRDGIEKGQVKFCGLVLINKVEKITQVHPKTKISFENLKFHIFLLDLLNEDEILNWQWINDRRNPLLSNEDSNRYAPQSWKNFVRNGIVSFNQIRKISLYSQSSIYQIDFNSKVEQRIHKSIQDYYGNFPYKFNSLASFITGKIIGKESSNYSPSWTKLSIDDFDIDFIGSLDIGNEIINTKLIVIGKASFENKDFEVFESNIDNLAQNFRRGWLGIHVTNGYFTENLIVRYKEEKYPILLINGSLLVKEINDAVVQFGNIGLSEFFDYIYESYQMLSYRKIPDDFDLI